MRHKPGPALDRLLSALLPCRDLGWAPDLQQFQAVKQHFLIFVPTFRSFSHVDCVQDLPSA